MVNGLFFAFITLLTVFFQPLAIVFGDPWVNERSELSSYWIHLVLFGSAFLVLLNRYLDSQKLRIGSKDLILSLPVGFLILIFTLSYLFHGEMPSVLVILNMTLLYLAGLILGKDICARHSQLFLYVAISFSGLVVFFSYYFFIHDFLVFWPSPVTGTLRPQVGTLLQSTEISNILAIIIIFGVIAKTNISWNSERILLSISLFPIWVLFIAMGAIGSFAVLTIVYLIFKVGVFRKLARVGSWIGILSIGVLLALAVVSLNGDGGAPQVLLDLITNFNSKLSNDERGVQYSELLHMIYTNPFVGSGVNAYTKMTNLAPHNNILGIWANFGFLLVFAYFFVLVATAIHSYRIRRRLLSSGRNKMLHPASVAFAMVCLYLHGKGLVQDTWQEYSLLFFTGCLFGSRWIVVRKS